MNPLTFRFKRAHWSAVKFGMRMFRGTKEPGAPDFDGVVDMTPARFDILYVIHSNVGWRRGVMGMPELRRALGLSRATISRAITRLVELGLVTKRRANGRSKTITLTRDGVARIRRALYLVFTGRHLSRHLRHFFATDVVAPRRNLARAIDEALDEMWWRTLTVAEHLGDTSEPTTYLFRRGANRALL